ncbi:helix-turn-helix domain-containing protein [Lactiplantibacillus songbeiensis]|jgi:transcriptional regulator with XRE-family HTH domain|uniref:Helix-turn-helix domain-containing protein n=1 Tax=Lactiplantibacillus songbeiensis TaxID=2559920 RepID=A0ABW4C307_9LACO|nr:helix-turn-helix transcriptional regulator [Lactiplantibacillus songbeiensis]
MLADELKRTRRSENLTLAAVSQQITAQYHVRISPSMLSRYENGYSISINHLFALAAFFNINLDPLVQEFARTGNRYQTR